jgi:hypothetical protein
MKYKLTLFFFFIISIFNSATAQTKHALIFAIGNYPAKNGWPVISSVKDISYVKAALTRQGFAEKNIKVVQDAAATVQGISNALKTLVDDENVKPGDIVVIHFSSHGEQVQDDGNDESDGFDESIVTYNATLPSLSKDFEKDQAEYFRDDQFGKYIDQLRVKLGGNGDLVVFMDACHSGSGTRGSAKVRGGQPPFVSKNFDRTKYSPVDTAGVFKEKSTTRGDEKNLATYVVFSAARAEELDHEANGMGSLSYAISKVFEQPDAGTTYRSLFAKIQSVMNEVVPGQHPVLEGNGIDRLLFGGKFVQQKPYVEIGKINGKNLLLKSGLLSGLDAGAKVAVYPSGTIDPSKGQLLASGIVVKSANYTSEVNLDKDPGITQPSSAWAFVTEPVFKIEPIRIGIVANKPRSHTPFFSDVEITSIKKNLQDLPLIKLEGEPELLIVKGPDEDSIKIASNGYLFKTIKSGSSAADELKEQVQNYAQYKLLRELEIKDPGATVEIKFVPVINGKPDTSMVNSRIVNGMYEFNEGDKIVLWVKNNGFLPVYLNVLDLQPDGIINPVFPLREKNIYKEELKIDRKSERIFSDFHITISPPYGTEIFKIFVSKQEIDMEGIATSRGAASRGNFTVLEKLVKKSYGVATRGTTTENMGNADGSTYNMLFLIKPPKN